MDKSKKTGKDDDLVVFSIVSPSTCSECGFELHKGNLLGVEKDKPLCLGCADLDHLFFLASGDAALTRRSRKYSALSAVVLRFSKARKRYERQGLLVELSALERAQKECLGDEEQRRLARERAAVARDRADEQYVARFEEHIRTSYPSCPQEEAASIANHACEKHSGRVGRSAAAKLFDTDMIDLAVRAHVRHSHTDYDRLLGQGWDRHEARNAVAVEVERVLEDWRI